MKTSTILRVGAVLGAVAATACNGTDGASAPVYDSASSLRRLASCDDLRDHLEDNLVESIAWGYGGVARGGVDLDNGTDAPADDGGGSGGDAPTDFTTTNVQEAGVDELDIVKMADEGRLMVVAQDKALHTVRAFPTDDVAKLGTLDLGGWTQGLFVTGDTAVVTVRLEPDWWAETGKEDFEELGLGWDVTRLLVVDLSDPTDPTVTRSIDFGGSIADARMVDGSTYFVVNQYLDLYSALEDTAADLWDSPPDLPEAPWESEDPTDWDAYRAEIRSIVRPMVRDALAGVDVAELLPKVREGEGDVTGLFDCGDIYVPQQQGQLSMLSVLRLDPATGDLGATGLMANGWTVYASTDNLYVAQSSQWWWGWQDDGQSHIHKFQLGDVEPAYLGSGSVDGWLYDQFAMSEHDGFLRAVTTDRFWGGGVAGGGVAVDGGVAEPAPDDQPDEPDSSDGGADDGAGDEGDPPPVDEEGMRQEAREPANNIFVLEDLGDGVLEVVGHVGDIAPGETVQSVRMMGEKGYVVTFRQVDPLFTVDLSDPYDPAIVGELKIPGFSAYLHPLGADHLIGVGMDGTDDGQLTGLAITVFDVSDMADPTEVERYKLTENDAGPEGWSWSWSESLWDHHAFTFHRDVLTIPVSMEHYDDMTDTWEGFAGTISFEVKVGEPITELGRVDHADLVEDSACLEEFWYGGREGRGGVDDGGDPDEGDSAPGDDGADEPLPDEGYCGWGYGWWGSAQIRRSAYVEDDLFTVSSYGVKVSELRDPASVLAEVLFYPADAGN